MNESVSLVRSTAGNYERVPNYVGKIVDLDKLESLARDLAQHEVGTDERYLADRFLKALERGRQEPD